MVLLWVMRATLYHWVHDGIIALIVPDGLILELVDILQNLPLYENYGARLPKGVLLVGKPGTGKTMLVRSMADKLEYPFFGVTGSDFINDEESSGVEKLTDLFTAAGLLHSPCIIFIDELDSIGKSRSSTSPPTTSKDSSLINNYNNEQTLTKLLSLLDGINTNPKILVLAATNRYDVIDEALIRPGRFDRIINVDIPDVIGREVRFYPML